MELYVLKPEFENQKITDINQNEIKFYKGYTIAKRLNTIILHNGIKYNAIIKDYNKYYYIVNLDNFIKKNLD